MELGADCCAGQIGVVEEAVHLPHRRGTPVSTHRDPSHALRLAARLPHARAATRKTEETCHSSLAGRRHTTNMRRVFGRHPESRRRRHARHLATLLRHNKNWRACPSTSRSSVTSRVENPSTCSRSCARQGQWYSAGSVVEIEGSGELFCLSAHYLTSWRSAGACWRMHIEGKPCGAAQAPLLGLVAQFLGHSSLLTRRGHLRIIAASLDRLSGSGGRDRVGAGRGLRDSGLRLGRFSRFSCPRLSRSLFAFFFSSAMARAASHSGTPADHHL